MLNLLHPLFLLLLLQHHQPALCSCRTSCNGIPISYPFGIDDGCGAPQFRHMLNCSSVSFSPGYNSTTEAEDGLFFITPSGNYKVQSIDYSKKTMTIFDPAMSTCSILQPHHDFLMTDLQSALIPPSDDTVFLLLNCSIDSPVLNHYKSLCFDFAGHSCDELYGTCNSFKLFHLSSSNNNNSSSPLPPPPCCFTGYDTLRYMSINILDCSHYTSVYNTDHLRGVGPADWLYGMKLSYGLPETGCDRCQKSGGMCGFDVETQGMTCICNMAVNATRECAPGTTAASKAANIHWPIPFKLTFIITFCALLFTATNN